MTILAIGAHPDDIEFGCGGVLIQEVKNGSKVHIICLTKGEAGSAGEPHEREQEAREAAKVMGASIEFGDVGGDCHVEYSLENRFMFARRMREIRPDIVLAPTTDLNQHPDHRITAELVRDACRLARYGGLKELKGLKPHKVSALYQYAITRFTTESPDIIYDVSDSMKQWLKAMNSHTSQVVSKDYIGLITSKSHLLGLVAGVQYGVGLWKNDAIVTNDLNSIVKTSRNF